MATISGVEDRFNNQHTNAVQLELFGHSLLITQDPNSKLVGTTVWDSALVLAKFLERNSSKGEFSAGNLAGKRAVELGAGCGMAGIAMALSGCNVVLTDQVEVLPLLLKNVDRNVARIKFGSSQDTTTLGSVEAVELVWGNDSHAVALDPPFDFVVCTDVVYAEHHIQPLVATMVSLSGPRTKVLMAYEFRSPHLTEKFQALCRQHFDIRNIPRKKMDAKFQHPNIQILVMSRNKQECVKALA